MKNVGSSMKETVSRWTPLSRSDAVAAALEGIAEGEITDFADLRALVERWPAGPFADAALETGFPLIKTLHWGYFAPLDPVRFPRLWCELVIPDRDYDYAGDLKRSISLPNLYIGLVDLHGYTRFCRENRRNLSRLTQLDSIIQKQVPTVVEQAGVLARRVRGDEILLIGASAADVLEAVLLVGEFFKDDQGVRNYGSYFPRFEIAAGIAGGQGFTALVVTEDGDLSGDAVNTAARLESRAGRVSPDRTRIMMTNHVHRKLQSELSAREEREKYPHLAALDFVEAGRVEFKGVTVTVMDAVFLDSPDARRLEYRDALTALYEALEGGLWKSKVFETALRLAESMGLVADEATAASSRARAHAAYSAFSRDAYEEALAEYSALLDSLESMDGQDELALEYLKAVRSCYGRILEAFAEVLDKETEASVSTLFGEKDLANYRMLQTHYVAFTRIREATRKRVRNRKALWYRVADQETPALCVKVGEPK